MTNLNRAVAVSVLLAALAAPRAAEALQLNANGRLNPAVLVPAPMGPHPVFVAAADTAGALGNPNAGLEAMIQYIRRRHHGDPTNVLGVGVVAADAAGAINFARNGIAALTTWGQQNNWALPHWTWQDAVARSCLQAFLDQHDNPPPVGAFATPHVYTQLPQREWWRLFVDVDKWNDALNLPATPTESAFDMRGLAFDREESRGHYYTMVRAIDTYLVQIDPGMAFGWPAMTAATYLQMHTDVVRGMIRTPAVGVPATFPLDWSGDNVPNTVFPPAYNFPRTEVDPAALLEMRTFRILTPVPVGGWGLGGAPAHAGVDRRLLRWAPGQLPANAGGNIPQRIVTWLGIVGLYGPAAAVDMEYVPIGTSGMLRVTTQYAAGDARNVSQALFDMYYAALAAIGAPDGANADQRLTVICDLIRALHVAHVFGDGNGRLNTMLLLNRLLAEQNLPPAIVRDTSVFGGRVTLAALVAAVKEGQVRFAGTVAMLP